MAGESTVIKPSGLTPEGGSSFVALMAVFVDFLGL